jgi:hypothetical protein
MQGDNAMIGPLASILVSGAGALWLAALLAAPQRPRRRDELADLVYARLVGRQQWMMAVAVAVTAAASIVLLVSV